MRCSKCGFNNKDDDRFCVVCGSRLPEPSTGVVTGGIGKKPKKRSGGGKWVLIGVLVALLAALSIVLFLLLRPGEAEPESEAETQVSAPPVTAEPVEPEKTRPPVVETPEPTPMPTPAPTPEPVYEYTPGILETGMGLQMSIPEGFLQQAPVRNGGIDSYECFNPDTGMELVVYEAVYDALGYNAYDDIHQDLSRENVTYHHDEEHMFAVSGYEDDWDIFYSYGIDWDDGFYYIYISYPESSREPCDRQLEDMIDSIAY